MTEVTQFPDEIAEGFREVAARIRTDPVFAPGQQYVYVFRAGEHVKVGIATDPFERWKAIASCNPLLEEHGYVTPGKFKHARRVEHAVHAKLAKHRVRYEWFRCSMQDAIDAVFSVTSSPHDG